MKPLEPNQPGAVYRHLNAAGEILYIGCSINPMGRYDIHRSHSSWARDVTRIDIQWFDTLDQALTEEQRQINTIRPPRNRQVNRKPFLQRLNLGPTVLRHWMRQEGVSVDVFAELTKFSPAEVCNVLKPTARPFYWRRVVICAVTRGRVPPWVWTSEDREKFDQMTDEDAASELLDTKRWACVQRLAGAA